MKRSIIAVAVLSFGALSAVPAEANVRAGMLTCTVAPGVSYLIGSRKAVDCVFKSVRGYRERYSGYITRVGIDVGYTSGGKIAWAVYAPAKPGPAALAGGYGGASAEATVAGGLGANVLIGGFRRSISLQPISVGAQTGLDLAVTASGLDLELAR
jgi:hypothetical protein